MRPLSTLSGYAAYAAVAAGTLALAGCSPTTPAPAPAPSVTTSATRGTTSPAPPSASPTTEVTSAIAPFTLPDALSRPVVFARGADLFIVGGLSAADTTTPKILHASLVGGSVQSTGRLAVPVHDAAGAVVAGRDLLFGGGSTTVSNAVQDVTPGTLPRVVGHLPNPQADLVAISTGDAAYVLGGFDGSNGSTTVLRTRDGHSFSVVATIQVSVRYPAAVLSGGSIWLFGGEHDGRQVSDVQRIDISTGRASIAGHLPHPTAHAGAFSLANTVFVAGGRIGAHQTDTVLRFDPTTVAFTTAGHLPAARSDFGTAVVAGTAYLVGGENPKPVDTVIEVRAQPGT